MKNNIYIIFLGLILFAFPMISKSQQVLDSYLLTAAENNPNLKAKFNSYLAALEKVDQVGTLPDPQLSFAYFIMPVETRLGPQQGKIGFTQMFPWFGTLKANEDVATSMAKAKFEQFEDAKQKLFFEVKSAYYTYFFVQKAIKTTEENIEILSSFDNLANVKIESGKASVLDKLRIEMQQDDLRNNLDLLADKQKVLKVKFSELLNSATIIEIQLPDSLTNLNFRLKKEALIDSILTSNHQLASIQLKKESFIKKESAAKKAGLPKLSVGIDYIFIGESDNAMVDASENGKDAVLFPKVGISLPIYRKKYNAMVNEAINNQKLAEFEWINKSNVLKTLAEKTWAEYQDAQRRMLLYEKQADRASKALNILEVQYATQGKNFEEILRMEQQLLKYKLEYQKALSDNYVALAFMDFLTSK